MENILGLIGIIILALIGLRLLVWLIGSYAYILSLSALCIFEVTHAKTWMGKILFIGAILILFLILFYMINIRRLSIGTDDRKDPFIAIIDAPVLLMRRLIFKGHSMIEEYKNNSIEAAMSSLRSGLIQIDIPTLMSCGQIYQVSVSVILDTLKKALLENKRKHDRIHLEVLLMAKSMQIQLVADEPSDFEIRSLSQIEQPILSADITLWEWLVKPLSVGERKILRILATNLVDGAGKRLAKSLPAKTIEASIIIETGKQPDYLQIQNLNIDINRSILRRLLYHTIKRDNELDAFCMDEFKEVHFRFTGQMDRITKFNILLENAETKDIYQCLRKRYPSLVNGYLSSADIRGGEPSLNPATELR